MTHFPCLTGNLEKEALTQMTLNLYGHTHQKTNFFEDRPYMFHVGVDSNNCAPISLDDIIVKMRPLGHALIQSDWWCSTKRH